MKNDLITRVGATVEEMVDTQVIPGATWAIVTGMPSSRDVHVESVGVHADDTIFRVASLTKPLAGALTTALVADGVVDLNAPVSRWAPELADRKVLRSTTSSLDDVEEPRRPLTVVDVVAMGAGLGWAEVVSGSPLEQAVDALELSSTWVPSPLSPDEWTRRVGDLPMAHQPGEGWLYQMSFDLLTVVLERAANTPIDELLRTRILEPLGMSDTGWTVPPDRVGRIPAQMFPGDDGVRFEAAPAADASLCERPSFCSLATGLVSTASDLARFGEFLLDRGRGPGGEVVPAGALDRMTTDLLGPEAAAMAGSILGADRGWGFGVGIDTVAAYPGSHPGRFGWDGGTGTTMWTDPTTEISAVMLTQYGMGDPDGASYLERFWQAVHAD